MRNPWLVVAAIALLGGALCAHFVAAADGGGSARFAAALGQIFGLPILLSLITPVLRQHRNIRSVSKVFALSTAAMTALAFVT